MFETISKPHSKLARLRSPTNGHVKTQLIAHENEVYDIAFSKCTAHGFASVGGDGSGIFSNHKEHVITG